MLQIAICGFLTVLSFTLLVVLFTNKSIYTKNNNIFLEKNEVEPMEKKFKAIYTLILSLTLIIFMVSLTLLFVSVENNTNITQNQSTEININSDVTTKKLEEKININKATQKELEILPGIGSVKANRIIEYRKTNKFDTVYELINVSGIGDKTIDGLRSFVTVGDET